jgi:hypothetical protein
MRSFLEARDRTTGRSAFRYVLGGARYNGFFSSVQRRSRTPPV